MGLTSCCTRDVEDSTQQRLLSLHERFAYITIIARQAHVITYLYRYPLDELPTAEYLHSAVNRAQRDVHHLWAEVVDGETPRPAIRLRPEGPWPPAEVVRDDMYAAQRRDGEEVKVELVEARLLESEIRRMQARAAEGGPAWQVTRYLPTTGEPGPHGGAEPCGSESGAESGNPFTTPVDHAAAASSYVAISFFHHIIDGSAGLNLSLSLLSGTHLIPSYGLAPRMEDLVRLSPSLPYLAKEAYRELLVPALPSLLRARLSGAQCWPDERVKGNPSTFPEAQETIHLPTSWAAAVKRVGKARGVSTVHPILEAAFVFAMRDVLGTSMPIDVSTPVNDRDSSNPACPPTAGVMVSALHKVNPPLPVPTPSGSTDKASSVSDLPAFWATAQGTAKHHASRSARKESRYHIGVLALVPNPKSFSSPHTDNPLRYTKTGWEDFFWSTLERPAPYRDSLVISNLGRIERLPPGCGGMRWTQSAAPFISPLCMQVVGHEAGLEICAAFREGCAVSREEARRILKRFEEIIADLVEEDND